MSKLLPIIKVMENSLPPHVLVCGDPERAHQIAQRLKDSREVAWNREYRTFTGTYQRVPLAVCSHGVGAAGAAVCFEELIRAGARYIIRVGTAGSLNLGIRDGDLVIAQAAVREDGLTAQLIPQSYPAVADPKLLQVLEEAAQEQSLKTARGIVLTVGAFYPGLLDLPNSLMAQANAKAVEMECSALFVIASLRGVAAGAILAIDGMAIEFDGAAYNPHREQVAQAINGAMDIALEALVRHATAGF